MGAPAAPHALRTPRWTGWAEWEAATGAATTFSERERLHRQTVVRVMSTETDSPKRVIMDTANVYGMY
jgi:hypothetical protein